MQKRPATPEEIAKTLKECQEAQPNIDFEKKHAESLAEGYKDETCECGLVYLAFHHYVACRKQGCPMSCGKTLFELWDEDLKKQIAEEEAKGTMGGLPEGGL